MRFLRAFFRNGREVLALVLILWTHGGFQRDTKLQEGSLEPYENENARKTGPGVGVGEPAPGWTQLDPP